MHQYGAPQLDRLSWPGLCPVLRDVFNLTSRLAMHIFVGSYFMGPYRLRNLLELKSTRRISTSYFAARLTITTPTMNSVMPAEERNALIFERFVGIKFLLTEQLFRTPHTAPEGVRLQGISLLTLLY
jgi:hypothetical protein